MRCCNWALALTTTVCCYLLPSADGVRHLRNRARTIDSLRWGHVGNASQFTNSNMTMANLYPFYHSTDVIMAEIRDLEKRCPGMTLTTKTKGSLLSAGTTSIDVVTVKNPNAKIINKQFILLGEHSRELIGPETGMHLLRALCGEGEAELNAKAKDALKESEFQIVMNGNPRSRREVEKGDFCLRVNPNGVDLNRNWADHWQPEPHEMSPVDTNPGPAPFSEPETQIFKELVTDFNPTTFLTIHAGTYGMYMPWAFNMKDLADRNQKEMITILKELDEKYCKCPYGAAGKEVGYACPGTCLDWVYKELKTPYAFAFEIYTSPQYASGLKTRWEEKIKKEGSAFYQLHDTLAHEHFRDFFADQPSEFVQRRSNEHHMNMPNDPMDCFGRFNPNNEKAYKETVDTWANSYLDLAMLVVADIKKGKVDMGNSFAANVTKKASSGHATV